MEKKKVRVAYVDHADVMGGAEHSLYYLLKKTDKGSVAPFLFIPPNSELEAKAKDISSLVIVNLQQKSFRKVLSVIAGIFKLARLLRQEKIDIVHTNSYRSAVYGLLAAKLAGKKGVWHVRDIHKEFVFTRFLPMLADKIIAISQGVAAQFPQFIQKRKVQVIYNGVDLEEFAAGGAGNLKEELGLRDSDILIGMVGRIDPWKGYHHLLRALPEVLSYYSRVQVIIVGEEMLTDKVGYLDELKELTRTLRLEEHVHFLGRRSDIPNIMGSFDLFVSYSDKEPFGRVIIEAMAMGTPVMVADSGGPPEIIDRGKYGYLVEYGNPALLAGAIIQAIQNKDQLKTLGASGKKRVEALFDAKQVSDRVQHVYESLLMQG